MFLRPFDLGEERSVAHRPYCWIYQGLICAVVAICLISVPLHVVANAHIGGEQFTAAAPLGNGPDQHAAVQKHPDEQSKAGRTPGCCDATCTAAGIIGRSELVLDGLPSSDTAPAGAVPIPTSAPVEGIERPPKDT